MIDVGEENKKIEERLQKKVTDHEELKDIVKKADELVKSTALSSL